MPPKSKSERLINDFIKRYKKEYDFYNNLAKKACSLLEDELVNAGVRAIVSYRAKGIDSLKRKLEKRSSDTNIKPYNKADDIYNDIIDLSGVRVALYFPGDIEIVESIIEKAFTIKEKKYFPKESNSNKRSDSIYSKRFSGYAANHYRICLSGNDRYSKEYKIEIQVASVLMHAWSEVEHDLIYKPSQGSLSKEELMILDEINGLVIAGNIALERLQKAGTDRVAEGNYEFKNHYDLSLFITLELGVKDILDSKGTFEFLSKINKLSKDNVKDILKSSKKESEKNKKIPNDLDDSQLATINILMAASGLYSEEVIDALIGGFTPLDMQFLRGTLLFVALNHSFSYPDIIKAVSMLYKVRPKFSISTKPSDIDLVSPEDIEPLFKFYKTNIDNKELALMFNDFAQEILNMTHGSINKQAIDSIKSKSSDLVKHISVIK